MGLEFAVRSKDMARTAPREEYKMIRSVARTRRGVGGYWLVLALVCMTAVWGCGKKEEPAPTPDSAPSASDLESPAVPEPIPTVVRPLALPALELMPEQASIALAIPSVTVLHDKAAELIRLFAAPETDVDAMLRAAAEGMAGTLQTPPRDSIPEVIRAKGLDPDAPIALFVDMASFAPIMENLEKMQRAAMPPAAMGEPGADAAEAEAPETPVQESMPTPDLSAQLMETPPAMVMVAGCGDPAVFEATLREATGVAVAPEGIESDGVTIHKLDPMPVWYFVQDGRAAVGTSLDMVQGVAARLQSPARIRYGTADCPAAYEDEVVMLGHIGEMMEFAQAMSGTMTGTGAMMAIARAQNMAAVDQAMQAFSGDDPIVTTLRWNDGAFEILTRLDMASHPGAINVYGEAAPLRQAAMMPADALAMIALRLTDESKAQLVSSIQASTGPDSPEAAMVAQSMGMINMVLAMVGEEITVGVTEMRDGMPMAVGAVALKDTEQTKGLLQMLGLPLAPIETFNDVQILGPPETVSGMPALYCAFPQGKLLVATDLDLMKDTLRRMEKGGDAPFLAGLTPPLDPATPRYSAMVIKSEFLEGLADLVLPLGGGMMDQQAAGAIRRVIGRIAEIRSSQEVVGDWQRGSTVLYLRPDPVL